MAVVLWQYNVLGHARDHIQGNSMNDFWVFGYGSLMWNPGFPFVESMHAQLSGYQRRLCIYSHVYRGTPENPGLVLGLAPDSVNDAHENESCAGMAFLVAADEVPSVQDYLRKRELVTGVYLETWSTIKLADERMVPALFYVANPDHEQFCSQLDHETAAAIIASAHGQAGANIDYVRNSLQQLRQIGFADEALEMILHLAEQRG